MDIPFAEMYFKFNKMLLFLLLVGINQVSSETCIPGPCLNGGIYNTDTQSCKPWNIGAGCEAADFYQNTCLNHGRYNEASKSCECAYGYTGETCGEKCKPGWKWHGNKCYFVSSTTSSWTDAMTACAAMSNGMLVKVNDAEENSFLKTLLSDDKTYWMGLRRFDSKHIFVWDSSNVILSYEDWASGEPNYGNGENCVHFFDKANGQQWNDVHCSSRKNYICETRDYCNGNPCLNGGAYNEENDTCICRMQYNNYDYRAYEGDACECKPGSRFNLNCYYISTDRRTWADAMTACGPSMHLVDLGSECEGGMLKQYLGDYEYWVGLTDEGHEGTYVWNWSCTLPSYTDWYSGKPTDSLGNENCVYLNRAYKNHTWNDGPCSLKLRYICEGELS